MKSLSRFGKGGWIWRLDGVDPILYRLEELIKGSDPVFIPEGESHVDKLIEMGLTATCNPFGAGKWRPELYNQYLKGRKLVILKDNDKPGEDHGNDIASSLSTDAEWIKMPILPGLPEKGDILDWLKQGGTKEKLLEIVEQTDFYKPSPRKTPEDLAAVTDVPRNRPAWPSPLKDQALHGLAGDLVKMVDPHTEADPAAILIQFLAAFGNVIGRTAYFQVEASRHYLKIFPVLVGETSKGRKGTSTGYIKSVFGRIDEAWLKERNGSGLSTGEGLIWQVRDRMTKREQIKNKGKVTGESQEIVIDDGVKDKRFFVIEEEFASILKVMSREGNILSPVIRQAWDDGNLRSLAKNSPAQATGAHISIVGQVTLDDLRRNLDRTETKNGFANRFIWICVKRSKTLPHGGKFQSMNIDPLVGRLRECVEFGKCAGEIRRDEAADAIWEAVYPTLSEGKPGLFGAVVSRSEAQVMRLACIYALVDGSPVIRKEHLYAALALWDYSEESARYIFGDVTGDWIADKILERVREAVSGLSRTQIRDLFNRNIPAERVDSALSFLEKHGFLRMVKENTGGRPVEKWIAV